MRPRRPVPDDFAQTVSRLKKGKPIRRHYRCNDLTFARWMQESGLALPDLDAMPDDFAGNAARMGILALKQHYRVAHRKIMRWIAESGVDYTAPARLTSYACPADFKDVAPTMTRHKLRAHYGVTQYKTINRWLAEAGIEAKAPTWKSKTRKGEAFDIRPGGGRGFNYAPTRTVGVHDIAADELRRNRWAVHRCDERGRYAEKGELWRVGNVVCDGDELLVRADRYRRVAA